MSQQMKSINNEACWDTHKQVGMKKKGNKMVPNCVPKEDTTTAEIPNPADTAMGPRFKTTSVTDKRRRKDKPPILLKRFRKYIEEIEK